MATNARLEEINEGTAAQLDVQVGLGLHPDSISMHGTTLVDGVSGPGETVYTAARSAMASMYSGLSDLEKANTAMLVPTPVGKETKMLVPDNRKAELGAAMNQKFTSVAKAVDRNGAVIDEAIATLSQRIAIATTNPNKDRVSVSQAASEIRAHVKALKNSLERMDFVRNAIEDGDIEIASAVLQTSCYTSGLNKQEHAIVRGMAESKFAPRETAQRDAATKVRAALQAASSNFLGRYAKLVPQAAPSKQDEALRRLRGA